MTNQINIYKVISFQNIKYCALHHLGGLYYEPYKSTQAEIAEHVDSWHKQRWPDFKSSLGFWGGYNFFIDMMGVVAQFRAVGEETAAQYKHNQDTVSICLAGNFSINPATGKPVDIPTGKQIESLEKLLSWLMDMGIKIQNIVPHRFLSQTECFGTALKDDWGRQVAKNVLERKMILISQLLQLYMKLLDLLRKTRVVFQPKPIGSSVMIYKYTTDIDIIKG